MAAWWRLPYLASFSRETSRFYLKVMMCVHDGGDMLNSNQEKVDLDEMPALQCEATLWLIMFNSED
jgi:hypothetical protein